MNRIRPLGAETQIGVRLARWRRRRGLSQSRLAALAGISQPYLSELESGVKSLDRPSTQRKLAEALQISLAQLLDQPGYPDQARNAALAHVPALRVALLELTVGERSVPTRSLADLRSDVAELVNIRNSGSWLSTLPRFATLLRDLAAHGRSTGGLTVRTLSVARFTLKHLGLDDLATEAAEVGLRVAQDAGDATLLSLARYSWIQSFPAEAARVGWRAANAALKESKADSRQGMEMTGWLHLLVAQQAAHIDLSADAAMHLSEARLLAKLLGEPERTGTYAAGFTGNWFSDVTVSIWEMAVAARLRDLQWAMLVRKKMDSEPMPCPLSQAWYRIELARALAAAGLDEEAITVLSHAERVAPQHFRMSRYPADLLAELTSSARRRANPDGLMVLAKRLGLQPLW